MHRWYHNSDGELNMECPAAYGSGAPEACVAFGETTSPRRLHRHLVSCHTTAEIAQWFLYVDYRYWEETEEFDKVVSRRALIEGEAAALFPTAFTRPKDADEDDPA